MSCNITAGIAKGCNDQVGGITGIHYTQWYPDLVLEKDDNGVVIRVYRSSNPNANLLWYFIEADNGMGNVTETYNVGGTGSILGFHQSANFFLPTTASASYRDPNQHLQEFIAMLAAQNNMVIGIETGDNTPLQGYSKKCYVFGTERPAYTVGGNKQTGITYTDNNGYSVELGADSKEPMNEIAYMAMHSRNLTCVKYNNAEDPTNATYSSGNYFQLEPLVQYEGGNIRKLIPGLATSPYPEIYVMPGELLTIRARIEADWNAAAFDPLAGTVFIAGFEMSNGTPYFFDITDGDPLPSSPGVATIQVVAEYENTSSNVEGIIPILISQPLNTDISGGSIIPSCQFLTITRTQ